MGYTISRQHFLMEMFQCFEFHKLTYCVLRNYDDLYNESLNDIDILLKKQDLDKSKNIIESIIRESRLLVLARPSWKYGVCYGIATNSGTIRLDIQVDFRYCGLLYDQGISVLENRIKHKNAFYVPNPAWEAAYTLMHTLFATGYIKEKYREGIKDKISTFKSVATTLFEQIFGEELGNSLIEHIRLNEWEDIENSRKVLMASKGLSAAKRYFAVFFVKIKTRIQSIGRFFSPRGRHIISFCRLKRTGELVQFLERYIIHVYKNELCVLGEIKTSSPSMGLSEEFVAKQNGANRSHQMYSSKHYKIRPAVKKKSIGSGSVFVTHGSAFLPNKSFLLGLWCSTPAAVVIYDTDFLKENDINLGSWWFRFSNTTVINTTGIADMCCPQNPLEFLETLLFSKRHSNIT